MYRIVYRPLAFSARRRASDRKGATQEEQRTAVICHYDELSALLKSHPMSSLKRAFDVVGACAGLLVFTPVMAVAIVSVLIDDGRPVLFRQQRLGYRRRPFSIIKIRTMRDGRITRVGRVLRATGLDEVTQFINILSGEMSAVGPRPLTEDDVRCLGWTGAAFDFRWDNKPGLTGLAQLVAAPSTDEALELDRTYTARWNPLLDCQLIALSFAVNVFGKSRVQQRLRQSTLARAESAGRP
jgi:lipopolysaccharide/colanic/teichoic acid biosynthesis glycosyltransferase